MANLKDLMADYHNAEDSEDDIALLAFRAASTGSLAKFDLVEQTVDEFVDSTGIDTSNSTNTLRTGGYAKGAVAGNATGGSITAYTSGGVTYKVHSFTSVGSTNFVAPAAGTIDYLIVAGGGGGYVGGAGGGGVVHATSQSIPSGNNAAVVGGGGATNTDGADSTFNSHTASGGGRGGGYGPNQHAGGTGGSGGGGGTGNSQGTRGGTSDQNAYSGTPNVTGYGTSNNAYWGGGYSAPQDEGSQGGAGAGGAGIFKPSQGPSNISWPTYRKAGPGGDGRQFDITGTPTYFAGGGAGGGSPDGGPGAASSPGGGGSNAGSNAVGTAGTANTGGGGAGSMFPMSSGSSGAGGSGIVIVRYPENGFITAAQANMTMISTATTASSQADRASVVLTYVDTTGTATINTDIKVYASRDGTNYTEGTLVDQGSTGAHKIVTANNIDISGQPAGTTMKYKVTTHNQSGSKETRVEAISLGWK